MAFQGGGPRAPAAITVAQIKNAGDLSFMRIDKSNVQRHIFPNSLINASFDFWQRGNGPFSLTGVGRLFGPDRVEIDNTGPNGTVTVSRTPLAFGDYPSRSRLSATFGCSGHSAASDGAVIVEKIEGVDTHAGTRVKVSAGLRLAAGAAGSKVFVELVQEFGAGGSAPVYIPVGPVTLTGVLTEFSLPVDVPSMSGKVIGTNDCLNVVIWISAGTNYQSRVQNNIGLQNISVQVADRELKEIKPGYGDQAPGFERIPKDIDFLRSQRFFQKSYAPETAPGTITVSGVGACFTFNQYTLFRGYIEFRVSMRVTPLMTLYNHATGAAGTWRFNSAGDKVATYFNASQVSWEPAGNGLWPPNEFTYPHWVANAEF